MLILLHQLTTWRVCLGTSVMLRGFLPCVTRCCPPEVSCWWWRWMFASVFLQWCVCVSAPLREKTTLKHVIKKGQCHFLHVCSVLFCFFEHYELFLNTSNLRLQFYIYSEENVDLRDEEVKVWGPKANFINLLKRLDFDLFLWFQHWAP